MKPILIAKLLEAAQKSIEANIETVEGKRFLTAGRNQFRSLWSRDFCFSANTLLKIGHDDVVKNQLELLFSHLRPRDGLVPRTMDSVSAKYRVSREVSKKLVPYLYADLPLAKRLKDLDPEYINEHATEAVDSNALSLLVAFEYYKKTSDALWWQNWRPNLKKMLDYYKKWEGHDGLIKQPRFSDWQDSVRRKGKTFFVNLLYFTVLNRYSFDPYFEIDPTVTQNLHKKINETFFDKKSGLYFSLEHNDHICLDDNLLAIYWNFIDVNEEKKFFLNLQQSLLWAKADFLPGFVTHPDYPEAWIGLIPKFVGLSHYHDRLYWSWLMGLSLLMAKKFNDERTTEQLITFLSQRIEEDGWVAEIYDYKAPFLSWRSTVFEAEKPFSWGAAFILEALTSYN
ncbi:MAG: hypothetical protein IPM57_03100 [Oligoflexia bacterium]|nr:hypothetical protein [Oligoflexia bacterium]